MQRSSTIKRPIAFYTPGLSTGGIGKIIINLTKNFVARGLDVDLIVANPTSPLMSLIPKGVSTFIVPTTHSMWSTLYLWNYLRKRAPIAVLTDRLRLNRAIVRASILAKYKPRSLLGFHNPLSVKLNTMSASKQKNYLKKIQWAANHNHKFIAVSNGVAQDLINVAHVPESLIKIIYNPLIMPEMWRLADEHVSHPFFESNVPVLVSAGRMTEQKDFPTLIHAFKKILSVMKCKLIILGEGRDLPMIKRLVSSLGLDDHIDLPGFETNPYKYFKRAAAFVLSSRWEGLGNVIVEALALGTPVVATDCPVGPREILEDGRLGRLVPVGDSERLAQAIIETLESPPPKDLLMESMKKFEVENSANGYLEAIEEAMDGYTSSD